jgi:hypothetical protein
VTLYKKTPNLLYVEKNGQWELLGLSNEVGAFLPGWAWKGTPRHRRYRPNFWWDLATFDGTTAYIVSNEP